MTPEARRADGLRIARRIDTLIWLALAIGGAILVGELFRFTGWGWALPPEACRQIGQRPTLATQHLPTCPRVERRAAKETTA